MTNLNQEKCIPCYGGESAISPSELDKLLPNLIDWQIINVDGIEHLVKVYGLKDFLTALEFTNRLGVLAEEEAHHPAILTEWGKVTVSWWTHTVGGLHRNDLIMAAKTDEIARNFV